MPPADRRIKLTSNQLKADQTSIPQETLRSHPPGVFALTGAKVIVSPEVTLDSATVVVRDGKIEAVGDLKVPDDAKEISLSGKTIYRDSSTRTLSRRSTATD